VRRHGDAFGDSPWSIANLAPTSAPNCLPHPLGVRTYVRLVRRNRRIGLSMTAVAVNSLDFATSQVRQILIRSNRVAAAERMRSPVRIEVPRR